MNRERWRQIDRIFEAGLGRPAEERPAYLDKACAGDGELRAAVESLLVAHGQEDGFMERPASADAAQLMFKAEAETLVGRAVGNYIITRRLGSGGMGEVYLAEDTRLARPAALKLLAAHLTADEERAGRFRQEALAASALNHPNIMTVYEIGQWRGRDFIATEYVEGVTLRTRMRGRGLSLAASLDIALQIAGALGAAHGAGIVHRDIKPENVMVRPDGLVKVLDFGIAKYTQPARAPSSKQEWVKTATGAVIGTTSYMSPEQARGTPVDARTDIWSLGVILYEVVARRLPFPGKTPTERVAAIIEREPEPLSKLRRGVPAELERVVSRALAKHRDERYARAADLAEDLRKLRATLGEDRPFRFALPAPARGLPFPHRRRAIVLAALLLVITAALVAGLSYLRPGTGGGGEREQRDPRQLGAAIESLAVLPFVNVGGSADTEYLSDGITESLINSLSQLPELTVMSGNSVFRYKGQEVDARTAGNTLRVRAVLTGRVAQRVDSLSVSVELVDARDGSHLWGEQYNRRLADIFDVQEDITKDITERLRLRLSKEERERLARRHTNNTEAYHLYLKGRYYRLKATPEGLRKSRDYFQRAVEADPTYALGYVGLAEYYGFASGWGMMNPIEGWPKQDAAAKKALELDDQLAEAHIVLVGPKWINHRDWAGAERVIRRVIEMTPKDAGVHSRYSLYLAAAGRSDEAVAEGRRALELDPLSVRYTQNLGSVFYYARRSDDAIRQYDQALELDPNNTAVHEALGDAYEQKGMYGEAVAEWRRAMTLAGDDELAAILSSAYARGGFSGAVRAVARKRLKRLDERSKRGEYLPRIDYARAYLRLGDKEQALRWLDRACGERNRFPLLLNTDPFYDSLRADPRFQDLVRRVGLPQ